MVNEDIGGDDETRWRTLPGDCSTVALLILNLLGVIKQSLAGMSYFQSFRHCETVDLRKVCFYYRFGNIRIFYAYIYIAVCFVRHVDHVTIDGRFLASVYSCKYMILSRRTKRFFSFMRLQSETDKLRNDKLTNGRKPINTVSLGSKGKRKKKDDVKKI